MGWPDFNEILGVFRESQSAFGKNMGILKSWKFRQVGVDSGESTDLRGLGGIYLDSLMDFTWGMHNTKYEFVCNTWKFRWFWYCVRAGASENNLMKIIINPIFSYF
jgi:hypothetical protein